MSLVVRVDDPDLARTFGNEQATVGQKCLSPRGIDAGGDNVDANALVLARDYEVGRVGYGGRGILQLAAADVQIGQQAANLIVVENAAECRHPARRNTALDRRTEFFIGALSEHRGAEQAGASAA